LAHAKSVQLSYRQGEAFYVSPSRVKCLRTRAIREPWPGPPSDRRVGLVLPLLKIPSKLSTVMDSVLANAEDREIRRMQKIHHPRVERGADRLWVVLCDECECDATSPPLLGINVPLRSRTKAELISENHAEPPEGRQGD
jgi:hypothetical protein